MFPQLIISVFKTKHVRSEGNLNLKSNVYPQIR